MTNLTTQVATRHHETADDAELRILAHWLDDTDNDELAELDELGLTTCETAIERMTSWRNWEPEEFWEAWEAYENS